jgi:hypothetical protein
MAGSQTIDSISKQKAYCQRTAVAQTKPVSAEGAPKSYCRLFGVSADSTLPHRSRYCDDEECLIRVTLKCASPGSLHDVGPTGDPVVRPSGKLGWRLLVCGGMRVSY